MESSRKATNTTVINIHLPELVIGRRFSNGF